MTRLVLALVAVLAACGSKPRVLARDAPVPWEASGIDWTKPPALAAPPAFAPKPPSELHLRNGVRVIVVENQRLPIVTITAVIDGAGSREDRDQPGVAALTADMLDEGAGQHAASSLRQRLEVTGVRHEIRIATDTASIQLVTVPGNARFVMPMLGDMLRAPRFDSADLDRIRAQRLIELAQRRQRARTVAAQVFDRVAFGAHPYALPSEGSAAIVAGLTAADLRAFWQRRYGPTALTLILVGSIAPRQALVLAESAFGSWTQAVTPSPPPPLAAFEPQLAIVDEPGAKQSVVLIGRRATPAGDPRQLAQDVANTIVGGGIGTRLDRTLHEQLALALGASASFWRGRWAGSWALATTFATDKTVTGIRAALDVVDQARTTLTAEELARAKADLLAGVQQAFDSNAGTARALERVVAQALPATWFSTYAARVQALALADVQAAADWRDLAIVIVGDRAKLGARLGELGLPIVQYDRDGTRQP